MDHDEFRRRLEAARTAAVLHRLDAVDMLALNVDLRHENGEALTRERARELADDGQLGVQPDPMKPPDAER